MAKKFVVDFTKGINLKPDSLGAIGILRLTNMKLGPKLATVTTRGGWQDNSFLKQDGTRLNLTYVNGIFRWYSPVGTFLIMVGSDADTGNNGIFVCTLSDRKCIFIQGLGTYDTNYPVQFVDCGNQLIILPEGTVTRPYSIKVNSAGNFAAGLLGLPAPTQALQLFPTELGALSLNFQGLSTPPVGPGVIGTADYKYFYTFSYGTRSNPNLYGESAPSPTSVVHLQDTSAFGGNVAWQIQLLNFQAFTNTVSRINIYRTLANGLSFYKIAEVPNDGVSSFNYDLTKDSAIDLSRTPPTETGLPGVIRTARYINDRLYYFGDDGILRASAAGYPDIAPANNFWTIKGKYAPGTWIGLIRDTIFTGKTDGIFYIGGTYPNHYWKKVSDVSCRGRLSMVETETGTYFLAMGAGNKLAIHKFDGNNSSPISTQIEPLMPSGDYFARKAYGKKVGDEYWLATHCERAEYVETSQLPFNNIILCIDTRYPGSPFTTINIQASSIESLDGPQDGGAVYITESDFANDANKFTMQRLDPTRGYSGFTEYSTGVRNYIHGTTNPAELTLGMVVQDDPMKDVKILTATLKARGLLYTIPTATIHNDSSKLENILIDDIPPESIFEATLYGDAYKFDVGRFDTTAKFADKPLARALYNFSDVQLRPGMAITFEINPVNGEEFEVEAIEIEYGEGTN